MEAGSEVRLHVNSRAIIGDRGCRGAIVHEQPRRKELRVGGQVGSDFLFKDCAGDLVHRPDPYRTAIGWGRDEQRQHTAGGDGKGRAHVGQGRRAGAVIGDHLPVGMGAALEADADAVQHGGQGQCGGQRSGGAIEAEEPHPSRLQGGQRQPGDEGPAAKACGVASPAGPARRSLFCD